MRLPSSYLKEPYQSAVRFTVVGGSGTLIQYGIYYAFLALFERCFPETDLTQVAFTIGFCLEMITNYLFTTFYTFSSKPSWKNLGGFLTGRGVNYVIQMICLNLLLLTPLGDRWSGFLAIVIAGVVNYFVVRIFFKKKPAPQDSEPEQK